MSAPPRDESHNVPYQVQSLIDAMLNKQELPHVKDNYRMRLESIRDTIDRSLTKFKNEEAMRNNSSMRRKR